ncbi:MAG: outer membrane beta-barrel protein [Verrucomicrobia bacterium]|nr:outer membrane beta-barrel protein [Verrucomicrobiota bacterium]
MNKKIVTLGVAALGVAAAQAADAGKIWEVTASLRGFYDDNYTTSPEALAEESWGIEVSPGISLTIGEGTDMELSARYAFGMRYYEDRVSDNEDYGHELGISLNKAFSDSSSLQLADSFVVAQEPEILNGGTPLRTEGDNLRNTFSALYSRILTESIGVDIGYGNSFYEFEEEYHSALLDRSYNEVSLDVFYITPRTKYFTGYKFSSTDFDGDAQSLPGLEFNPEARNNHAHYGYVGAIHQLNKFFLTDVKAGVQNVDYYDADLMPGMIPDDETSPYVDARMEWGYDEGCKLVAGVSLVRGATDLQAADQEITSVYAQVLHQITPSVHGSLTGRYQDSEISGGGAQLDGKEESLLLLGGSLTYAIADNIWAELAYNYDELDSDIPHRSFERNVVAVGIGASY